MRCDEMFIGIMKLYDIVEWMKCLKMSFWTLAAGAKFNIRSWNILYVFVEILSELIFQVHPRDFVQRSLFINSEALLWVSFPFSIIIIVAVNTFYGVFTIFLFNIHEFISLKIIANFFCLTFHFLGYKNAFDGFLRGAKDGQGLWLRFLISTCYNCYHSFLGNYKKILYWMS